MGRHIHSKLWLDVQILKITIQEKTITSVFEKKEKKKDSFCIWSQLGTLNKGLHDKHHIFIDLPYWEKFEMRLSFIGKTSTWVTFASLKSPWNFLQRAWSCKLKSWAARLWELTHPRSSSFEGSFPNAAITRGKHPRGPVLWIQKFLAPWSYNSWERRRVGILSHKYYSKRVLWWSMH